MTDANWDRLWSLFRRALEQAPERRAAWIEQHCSDPEQRRELERLLEADARHVTPLDRRPQVSLPIAEGARIGPWRIIGTLGHGGMGEVYRVARADGAFERLGALKLLAPWHDTASLAARFEHERRILASLDHPAIARLLDAGATEDGRPWLVMEAIEGCPITDFCRQHEPELAERLGLFSQVCQAVAHAHRKLIVHRDLKPANILINDCKRPVLLDFGIAKLLDSAQDPRLTAAGQPLPLTPRYASPEQVNGQESGVAVDVYALGVVLYELLAGVLPFGLDLDDRAAWLAERRAGPPPLPPSIPGELNWIVHRALQFEPEERYPDVDALRADILAVRQHRPPRARAVGPGYRLRKFTRRNWRWLAGVGAVLTVVCGLTAGLFIENRQSRQASAEAEQAQNHAERVADFLVSLFEMADATRNAGRQLSAGELLERGRRQLRHWPELDPGSRIAFLLVLSDVNRNLGDYPSALALAAEASETARLQNDAAAEVEALQRLGTAHHLAGDGERAGQALERALELAGRLEAVPLPTRVTLHHRFGQVLQGQGRLQQAGEYFRKAADVVENADQPHPALAAESALRLGSWHWLDGRLDEAERHYARALQWHRDTTPVPWPELATARDAHAAALYSLGRLDEAEAGFAEAAAIRRRVLGANHPKAADSLSHLGAVRYDLGRHEAAERVLREALAIYEDALGTDSPVAAGAWNNLGLVLRARDRTEAARQAFDKALSLNRSAYGRVHHHVAGNLNNLGLIAEDQSAWDDALSFYREADNIIRQIKGEEHADRGFPLTNQGRVHLMRADHPAATKAFRQALALRTGELGPDHPRVAETLYWWGLGDCAFGRHETGLASLERAHAIRIDVFEPDSEAVTGAMRAVRACRRPGAAEHASARGLPETEATLLTRISGAD